MWRWAWCGLSGLLALPGCSRKALLIEADAGASLAPTATLAPPTPRPTVALTRVGDGRTGSSVVLARWMDRIVAFVADEDDAAVRAIDVDAGQELSTTPLPSRPGQLLVAPDGRLLVAMRDESTIASFHATDDLHAPLGAAEQAATAVEPLALAATPDDATILVASGWGHALEAFRAATLERTFAVDLPREPRAIVTSSDGAAAFVAHAVDTHVSVVDLRTAAPKPAAIDLTTGAYMGGDDESGPDFPSRCARGAFAIVRFDGKRERLFVPHVLVDPGNSLAVTQGYGGAGGSSVALPAMRTVVVPTAGTHAFEIDAIDPGKRTLATPERMPMVVEDTTRGGKGACLLPRAAATDEGGELLIACLGIDEVRAYDASKDDPSGWRPRRRWSVPGGPTGIAVDDQHQRAVVWEAFDGVLSVLSLALPLRGSDAAPSGPARVVVKRTRPLPPDVSVGRKLFFDAGDPRIAKDGRGCASCHIDGRDDGFVWSSPEGPRQTMMLAGRVDHGAPFGWLGEHATLQEHLAQTLKNLAGTGLEPGEVDALVAWLKAMKGPPSPDPTGTPPEARGREVFLSAAADCSSCHVPKGGFSDRMLHEVGSKTAADRSGSFITPTLRFLNGTAPYFHDGRYATLADLLHDPKSKMGGTKQLSPGDVDALEAFLRTL